MLKASPIQLDSTTAVLEKAQRELLAGRLSNTTRISIKKMNLNAAETGIGDSLITGLSKSKVVASIVSHGVSGIESAADILAVSEVVEAMTDMPLVGEGIAAIKATAELSKLLKEQNQRRRSGEPIDAKEIGRISATVIGVGIMAGIVASASIVVAGPLIAARAVARSVRSVIKHVENEKRFGDIKERMAQIQSEIKTAPDHEKVPLIAEFSALQKEHKKLKYKTGRLGIASEALYQAGSVAQVAGGIMCCFPATLPLGLGLIAIGALSKIVARNIIPKIAKKFDKTVDHNAAAEQDYLNDVTKQIGEPLTLVMQLSDNNEAIQKIQEKFEKAKSDFADGKLSLDEFKQEVKETIRATGDLGVTSYMNLAKLEKQLEKIPTPTERIAEAQKSESSAEAEATQEASAGKVAPT